ncbi:lipopolysaccharide biosynthesis protein [Vibrio sp. SCSIO 43086]|uniref:lipopolysaccharide biosynthesis protein n=1 Tax=Vibrio sp. SCSIO 43086 TaxID=2822845 RepID=UPI003DA899E5
MRDFLGLLFSKFTVLILSVFVVFVQAKALGAEQRGMLAMILLLPQLFVSITDGGMRQAISYLLGKKSESEANILGSVRLFTYISVMFWGSILLVLQYLYLKDDVDIYILLLSVLILPFIVLVNSYRGVFIGRERINNFSKTLLVPRVTYFFVIVLLYYMDQLTLEFAFFSFLFFHFFSFVLSRFLCKRDNVSFNISLASRTTLSKIFRLGIIYAVSLFFIDFNYKAGLFIISQLSDSSDVGNYIVSTQVVEFIWQIPAALSIIIFSKSVNKKEHGDVWVDKLKKVSRVQFFIGGVFSLFIGFVLHFFVPLALGQEYDKVSALFFILIPGIVFMSVFKLINVDFAGRGKPIISLYFMPIILVLNCLMSYIIFPYYNVYGVAISVSISYVLSTLIAVLIYEKKYSEKLSILDYFIVNRKDFNEFHDKIKSIRSEKA